MLCCTPNIKALGLVVLGKKIVFKFFLLVAMATCNGNQNFAWN